MRVHCQRNRGEHDQRRDHRSGNQTVQTVGQIHRVNGSGNGKDAEHEPQPVRRVEYVPAHVEQTFAGIPGVLEIHQRKSAAARAVSKYFVRARSPALRPAPDCGVIVDEADQRANGNQ